MIVLLNKPFNVLTQFTANDGSATLADFIDIPNIYAAGRLDKDSEGLVVLTDDGILQHRITDPKHKLWKIYWVQVEGTPSSENLLALRNGVTLNDGITRPARVKAIDSPPSLWPRDPPIRHRMHIPTQWLELCIREGRNRQVRRMTAAIGHPTLRLIRYAVGDWNIDGIAPGQCRRI